MLRKFVVSKYRRFAERIELDLMQSKNYGFNDFVVKNGLIKNGIIYGTNGSGKSNFSLAIFDITNHPTDDWKNADYYDSFVYVGNIRVPVSFEFNEIIIDYSYNKKY